MALRVLILAMLMLGIASGSPVLAANCTPSLQDLVNAAPSGSIVNVPACTYHETVRISKPITLDGRNQAVITGDNVRDRWLWITSSDVTIKNFSMRDTATAAQEGAIGTERGIARVVIDHNDLGATLNGEQVGIGGTTDSRVTNNLIHDGGQMGIGTYQNVGLTISGNHIWHNNTAGNDPYWAAGGIKAVNDNGLTITNNEVDHNAGPGIWCDISCTNVTIANNNVHDHAWNAIFYEISSNGDIYGNTISASNTGAGDWGCIVVSSSGDTRVHDNTCVDTLPLRAQLDNRPDVPSDAGFNVRLENNKLLRPVPNQATSWWQYDSNGPLVPGRNGNVDLNNQIVASLTPVPTATLVPTVTPTLIPTATSTPTPRPTATPTVQCEVNVKLAGVEQGWKPC